jgi:hypothetical protein
VAAPFKADPPPAQIYELETFTPEPATKQPPPPSPPPPVAVEAEPVAESSVQEFSFDTPVEFVSEQEPTVTRFESTPEPALESTAAPISVEPEVEIEFEPEPVQPV